jgi:hypothetical protein
MRIESLSFAGYRSFAARSPGAPSRALENFELAPLTLVLGKNNSGKSTTLKLLHHVLHALASTGPDPFPMRAFGENYGGEFRDIQHANNFFNPLDIRVSAVASVSSDSLLFEAQQLTFEAQINQLGDLDDEAPPSINFCAVNGKTIDCEAVMFDGLLPDINEMAMWRKWSRELSDQSCHIPPVRQEISRTYEISDAKRAIRRRFSNDAVAHMMLGDIELKNHVAGWISENLGGWKIDTKQNLDSFQLVAKKPGREINLADSGQGIQQVLPFVALCCKRGLEGEKFVSLDIVEQPELHLHDAAHAGLGDLLINATQNGRGTIVVETHSEALVLRVRRRIAEGTLKKEKVAIYYVDEDDGGSRLRRIVLDDVGEVDWWPEGVFSESFAEVKAIRQAQRVRA